MTVAISQKLRSLRPHSLQAVFLFRPKPAYVPESLPTKSGISTLVSSFKYYTLPLSISELDSGGVSA